MAAERRFCDAEGDPRGSLVSEGGEEATAVGAVGGVGRGWRELEVSDPHFGGTAKHSVAPASKLHASKKC